MVYSSPAFFGPGFNCAHVRWQWRTITLKEYKKIVPAGYPVWDFLLLCLGSHCILPPLLHQSFISLTVHLGIVYEQLPRSQPLAALISLHVVKELKSKCYASTQRPFKWDIKSVAVPQGLTSNFSVIFFFFTKLDCGMRANTHAHALPFKADWSKYLIQEQQTNIFSGSHIRWEAYVVAGDLCRCFACMTQ